MVLVTIVWCDQFCFLPAVLMVMLENHVYQAALVFWIRLVNVLITFIGIYECILSTANCSSYAYIMSLFLKYWKYDCQCFIVHAVSLLNCASADGRIINVFDQSDERRLRVIIQEPKRTTASVGSIVRFYCQGTGPVKYRLRLVCLFVFAVFTASRSSTCSSL
jgi:hypothetical protein